MSILILYFGCLISYVIMPKLAILLFIIVVIFAGLKRNINTFLLYGVIFSIPLSFINIWGGNYGSLPLSWFNIFCLLYIINLPFSKIVLNNKIVFGIISFLLIFVTYLVSTVLSRYPIDSFKSLISNFLSLVFLLCCLINSKKNCFDNAELFEIEKKYIYVVFITALAMLFFRVLSYYGIEFENSGISFAGKDRIGNRFLWSDYSFLSLFFASVIPLIVWNSRFENLWKIAFSTIIIYASIDTTARTGIAALACFAIFLTTKYFFSSKLSIKKIVIVLSVFVFFVIMISFLMIQRGGQDFFESNDRILNINNAAIVFSKNPIFGVGIGANTYSNTAMFNYNIFYGAEVPHNLFVQSLLSTGIIGLSSMIVFFFYILSNKKKNGEYFMLVTTLIGSMFIPDIFVSRFLMIQILFVWMSNKFN